MLQENNYYIMEIIFDGKQYVLPLVSGSNPKFYFDELIQKEMKYEEMEEKYMEITLHYLPTSFDIYQNNKKQQLIEKSSVYSSFKIDLLSIAFGPAHHDIVLLDPKNKNSHLGRISYTLTCKHLENIDIKITQAKIQMNYLLQSETALKIVYNNNESNYSKGLAAKMLTKVDKTEYEYTYAVNSTSNKKELEFQTKCSMDELRNADSTINVYTFRLIDPTEGKAEKNKDFFEHNPAFNFKSESQKNIKLINQYNLIGYVILNFIGILSENDAAMQRQTSQFFRTVSGFNNKNSNNDIQNGPMNKKETNSRQSFANANKTEFEFQIFQNISQTFQKEIFFDGIQIGSCELTIEIKNIPLIRQIMFGVMTENGFEINSIYLYDNLISPLNKASSLPQDLQTLAKQKINLDSELVKLGNVQGENVGTFNVAFIKILNEIKNTLEKSIEDNCLYYGYSNNEDLYTGQHIMLDIGITLLDVINKVNNDQRISILKIIKILNDRSEFDLGTLYTKWFNDIDTGKSKMERENKHSIDATFKSNKIITDKQVENFFEFNYQCLSLALDGITRMKTLDPQSRSYVEYFLSVAYFRLPCFRKMFLEGIMRGVTEKFNFETDINHPMKKESFEDYIEVDPINYLILWEDLFYARLGKALTHVTESNEIEETRTKITKLITTNNPNSNNWLIKVSKRDNIFFNLVKNLNSFITNKVNSHNINWINIPGYDCILNAILHEISVRDVRRYPSQLQELFPLFVNNMEVIKEFIKRIIQKTNVYDVNAVFNFVSILDSLFVTFRANNPEQCFNKFDYNILSQAMRTIIKIDHSLCVAKFLWFYYKNAHLMSMNHIGEICQSVFISKFYNLFFHWSWQVRNLFYNLILYIMGFRIKNQIPFKEMEDLRCFQEFEIGYVREYAGNVQKNFSDILEDKFALIIKIKEIINKEHNDPTFNNIINYDKYNDILSKIPQETHKNIVVSMHHFDTIKKEFMDWEKINKDKREGEIEDPNIVLVTPKDDVVDYSQGYD